MSFLDLFPDPHRALFEAAATRLDLARGQYLLRRGEPGGDIYMVLTGTLEIVDSRSTPEVILAILQTGALVGEMAFLDDSPRSADARGATDCTVLQWPRDDLRALLTRNPVFAAVFYERIAQLAANRIRQVTTTAMSGALGGRKPVNRAGIARVQEEARRLAELTKESFIETETRLRQDASDKLAQQQVRTVLDRLEREVKNLLVAHPDAEAREEASRVLCRELHPYLVRSSLAERCIRRPQGVSGTAEILAHVLVNSAGGDGQIGELLDRWLLDRPTLRALRAHRDPCIALVRDALPRHRNRRVLLVNAGTGSLVAGLSEALGETPTVLTVVDQSKDALAFLDAAGFGGGVDLVPVQENLVQLALGRGRHPFPPQDCVVLNGLLEYMPDRIAVSLLEVARGLLAPGGAVVVTALAPSPDDSLLDWLLSWPTIRREPAQLHRLFAAADLAVRPAPEIAPPALLCVGAPEARTPRPSPGGARVLPLAQGEAVQ